MYTYSMIFPEIQTPFKITPCPIYEAIVELRFESSLPEEVIAGLLYPGFKDKFPEIEKLPILELPPAIRNGDPNLIYSPHFRFKRKDMTVNVGPRVFSVACPHPYVGWTNYSAEIQDAFKMAIKIGLINKAVRLGVRYINFFKDTDVFKELKVGMELNNNSIIGNKNNLRTEIIEGNFVNVVHVANNANIVFQKQILNGSIIDIDIVNNDGPSLIRDLYDLIEEAHNKEKLIFFSLLNEEFLKTMHPEY